MQYTSSVYYIYVIDFYILSLPKGDVYIVIKEYWLYRVF